MNRIDILTHVCDMIDESINDNTIKPRLLRFIDKAYLECLRREYKEPPIEALTDSTKLLTDDRNSSFIAYFTTWLHYLNEGDTSLAGIYKDEYEGFRIYKAPKEPIKVIDVYEIGEFTNDIVGVSEYE